LEQLSVDERIILKWSLTKLYGSRYGPDTGSEQVMDIQFQVLTALVMRSAIFLN
jgi:hypothetical protein